MTGRFNNLTGLFLQSLSGDPMLLFAKLEIGERLNHSLAGPRVRAEGCPVPIRKGVNQWIRVPTVFVHSSIRSALDIGQKSPKWYARMAHSMDESLR